MESVVSGLIDFGFSYGLYIALFIMWAVWYQRRVDRRNADKDETG